MLKILETGHFRIRGMWLILEMASSFFIASSWGGGSSGLVLR